MDTTLRADCANCFGLCCVALPFAASADFAADKPAGTPCGNLREDFGCGIHARLRDSGYRGCTVYDCFGAGQHVSQVLYGGTSWREEPTTAAGMFAVFPVVRQLHELLHHLDEALSLPAAREVHPGLRAQRDTVAALTRKDPAALIGTDVDACRREAGPLLGRASELARAGARGGRRDRRGADLMGARLRGADLRGTSLRGAWLIAADLSGADLRLTDLLGADLRDADLAGADLTGAVFLTQPQVNAARGDGATRLPGTLTRPAHWA
ncbi:pentapeptide repeat-containing protein [Streptomyces sp. NPDC005805]|uniref:pentapeptide repeat-containing protein n=1 Tax=Streptomyces sp. NPDC005805 TaxID=3157068 RepID=UPI0033DB3200